MTNKANRFGYYGFGKNAVRYNLLMGQSAQALDQGFTAEAERLAAEARAIGTYGTLPI